MNQNTAITNFVKQVEHQVGSDVLPSNLQLTKVQSVAVGGRPGTTNNKNHKAAEELSRLAPLVQSTGASFAVVELPRSQNSSHSLCRQVNDGSTLTTTVNLVAKRPINLMFDLFHEVCYGRVLVHI